MIRLVLDTNVLVSALLTPHGKPASVLNFVLAGQGVFLANPAILSEYQAVLTRPKFAFPPTHVAVLMSFLKAEAEWVLSLPLTEPFVDESDRKFYEVAIAGKADALVTGNLAHFPKRDWIVSPAAFLAAARPTDS